MPCAGHTLNLSVQKAFDVPAVERGVGRAKKLVAHFTKSCLDSEELEMKQGMLELPKHKLIQVWYNNITHFIVLLNIYTRHTVMICILTSLITCMEYLTDGTQCTT